MKVGGWSKSIIFVVKMVEVDICEKPEGIARGGQDECFLNSIFKYSHGEKIYNNDNSGNKLNH